MSYLLGRLFCERMKSLFYVLLLGGRFRRADMCCELTGWLITRERSSMAMVRCAVLLCHDTLTRTDIPGDSGCGGR